MATYNDDDIEQIEKIIKTGASVVEFKDRRTEFRPLSELKQILSDMKDEVAAETKTKTRQYRISSGRGF